MRRLAIGTGLLAAAGLLSACGSGNNDTCKGADEDASFKSTISGIAVDSYYGEGDDYVRHTKVTLADGTILEFGGVGHISTSGLKVNVPMENIPEGITACVTVLDENTSMRFGPWESGRVTRPDGSSVAFNFDQTSQQIITVETGAKGVVTHYGKFLDNRGDESVSVTEKGVNFELA